MARREHLVRSHPTRAEDPGEDGRDMLWCTGVRRGCGFAVVVVQNVVVWCTGVVMDCRGCDCLKGEMRELMGRVGGGEIGGELVQVVRFYVWCGGFLIFEDSLKFSGFGKN